MTKQNPNILIAGAGESQRLYADKLVDPSILASVPGNLEPHITFYDPNREVILRDDLVHLHNGVREGKVNLVHSFPDDQFDAAIVATSSQHHADAVLAILDHQDQTPLFVLEKPIAASRTDLARVREVEAQIQPRSIVNEPYFVMHSIGQLIEQISQNPDNPLVEAHIWSSKARNRINPHGELGIYAIELPHLHGVASRIAGRILSTDTVQENIYYADVQGISNNDGNYMRFEVNHTTFHVAQGLGRFIMDQRGNMLEHQNPPRTRSINLRFADGSSSLLDIDPAFPRNNANAAAAITYHYEGDDVRAVVTPDDPRREMIRHILRRIHDPALPNIPGISLSEALERNQSLLDLRNSATIKRGLTIPSSPEVAASEKLD